MGGTRSTQSLFHSPVPSRDKARRSGQFPSSHDPGKPYLTMVGGAERYGFSNGRQFRAWCHRNNVPLIRRGRKSRVLIVLVRHVEQELISLRTGRPVR